MLILAPVLGSLWMGSALIEGIATGQTPPSQLPPTVVPPAAGFQPPPPPPVFTGSVRGRLGFNFTIQRDTPLKDLLPIPPKASAGMKPLFMDDISQVPEVAFQEPLAKTPEALKLTAHTIAKINHLNRNKADGFMEALLHERADLAGLPIAMGDTFG